MAPLAHSQSAPSLPPSRESRRPHTSPAISYAEADDPDPGPGSFDIPSGWGPQLLSTNGSGPSFSVTAKHDESWSKTMITKEHCTQLMGRGTPGPGTYGAPMPLSSQAGVFVGTALRLGLSDTSFRAPGPVYDMRTNPTDVSVNTKFAKAGRFDAYGDPDATGPGQYEYATVFDGQRLAKSFGASHRAYDSVKFPGNDRLMKGKNSSGPGPYQPFNNDGKRISFCRAQKLPPDLKSGQLPGPGQYNNHTRPPPDKKKPRSYSFGRPSSKPRVDWKSMSITSNTTWGTM